MVNNRLLKIVLPKIHDYQFQFFPDKSTTDGIQATRILTYADAAKDLYMIFIDLKKYFDRIPCDLIWSHEVPEARM